MQMLRLEDLASVRGILRYYASREKNHGKPAYGCSRVHSTYSLQCGPLCRTSMVRALCLHFSLILTFETVGMARLRSPLVRTLNPIFIIISLFWTFWNRTWLQARRKGMRIKGRKESMVGSSVQRMDRP